MTAKLTRIQTPEDQTFPQAKGGIQSKNKHDKRRKPKNTGLFFLGSEL